MNQSNVTTQPSLSTRVRVWFDGLPFVTRAVLVVCLGIYVAGALIGFDDYGKVCLSADRVLWHGEVWRFVTAAVFHMGALHIAFNMLAFVPIGMSLERSLGSVAFMHLMLLLVVLGDAAYVFFSFVAAFGPARLGGEWVRQCAVGLSGVIFGLIVADNAASRATHRSIFGFFSVPAALYPWALLVFWQLVMPGASFLGHLCGVLVGQLYVWGLLKWLLLPERALRFIESSRVCAPCYNSRSFIAASGPAASATCGAPPLPVSYTPTGGGGGAAEQQQQQRGSWFNGGWLRLPASDPANASTGGGGGGGGGSGLFGLGGSHGTAGAPFAGRGRTIGATDRALPQGVPAYAANAGISAAPAVQRPQSYPTGPNIAGGPGTGDIAGTTLQAAGSKATAKASEGGGGGSSGGRKLDPHAAAMPAVAARAAAAAAAEARARRSSAATVGSAAMADGVPPSRPMSLPSSPPSSSRSSGGPQPLRPTRSEDSGTLQQVLDAGPDAATYGPAPTAKPSAPSQPTGPESDSWSPAAPLQQLVAMGFTQAAAREALAAAGGDVSAAVDLLSSK